MTRDVKEALRLRCPMCGNVIRHVFGRSGGPQDATHNPRGGTRRHTPCQLIVTPDTKGRQHRFERVPPGMGMEAFLDERRADWKSKQAGRRAASSLSR